MHFYLDEDLSDEVAIRLRQKGLDCTCSHEEGRNHRSDREQLSWAASQGRAMVTRNRDDFVAETLKAFENLEPHAGVLVVPYTMPNNQFSRIANALEAYHHAHLEGMQAYTIDFLSG